MKALFIFFIFIFSVSANDKIEQEVNDFLKRLDGNYKERKEASKQLNNLPLEFYPYLKKHLEQENVSLEVKLRLSKDKMFPLRAKWLHQKRMDWYRLHTVEAYQKFGDKNPKWDKEVLAALELVLIQFNEYWYIQGYANAIGDACQKAVSKGCKDPLILYFLARGNRLKLDGQKNIQLKKMHLDAETALRKSQYHDYFKFRSTRLSAYYARLKNNRNNSTDSKGLKAGLAKMLESLPYFQEMIKDKDLPFIELFYNSEQFCGVYKDCGKNLTEGLKQVRPLLEKQYGPNSQEVLSVEGIVALNAADAISNVDYEESRRAEEAAIKILGDSWEIDPAKQDIAVRILKTLRHSDDRQKFELWYNNILLADPGNLDAFAAKRDFLMHGGGSLDDLWAYGEEIITKGGPMTKQIPVLIDKIGVRIADDDPDMLFDFNALYKNSRAWELLNKAQDKYFEMYPEDASARLLFAHYAATLGYWEESHKLFLKAGNINQYKGRISLDKIKESKLEASIYHNKKITPLTSLEQDFEGKAQKAYERNKKSGHYNFLDFYKEVNGAADPELEKVLNLLSDDWYHKPEVTGDILTYVQKTFEMLSEIRKKGNKDPLVHLLWANTKDNWYRADESEYFKAAKLMVDSKYPDNLKLLSICVGLDHLGRQKNISEEDRKTAAELARKVPEFITRTYHWPEQYYHFFNGLSSLKLLSSDFADPVINKYKDLGMVTEQYIAAAHFNNRMAWYTHSLSKKKNWKLINQYNREAKASMKNAWMNDPHNSYAAEGLFRFSDRNQNDYVVNLKRAIFANPFCYSILKKFMNESSNSHGRSSYWTKFSILDTKVTLLHYVHALDHAKARKEDPDVLNDHWHTVSESFEKYLNKFPNDTIRRSQYAQYAIDCNKADVAKEQLKVLGKYAVHWVFGSEKKLKEYQDKYLKE